MTGCLARHLATTNQHDVGTGGTLNGQLVECVDTTSGGDDASTGGAGDLESTHVHLGHLEKTLVVRDVTDDDGDGVVALSVGKGGKFRQRNWRTVDL